MVWLPEAVYCLYGYSQSILCINDVHVTRLDYRTDTVADLLSFSFIVSTIMPFLCGTRHRYTLSLRLRQSVEKVNKERKRERAHVLLCHKKSSENVIE